MKRLYQFCLIFMLVLSLAACSSNSSSTNKSGKPDTSSISFTPGTYTGVGSGNNGDIKVEVKLSDEKIESVKVLEHNETEGIAEPAIEKIPKEIIQDQSLNIDVVSGASNVSKGILDAVANAIERAGGNVEALRSKEKETVKTAVEEMTTDVVIVGGGAAGTAAAVAASEAGSKVVLLEKAASVSGAGSMAGVLFADHSSLQKEAGKEVDSSWLYDQYMEDSNYYANSKLVSAIINKSASTVDWLIENGVRLTLLDAGYGSQYNHVGMPTTAHGYVDGGNVALKTLHDKVVSYGNQVMYETAGESLIFDKNKKVTGVVAKKADGTELRINAKSVIMATGGFGGNEKMMAEVFGEKAGTGLVSTATGDGINMAWSAGAQKKGLDVAQWFGMTYNRENSKKMKSTSELTNLVRNPLLFVNNKGERFGSEEEAYESAALGTMMYNQPDSEMFIILDKGIIKDVAEKGLADVFVDRWAHMYGKGIVYSEAGHANDVDAETEAWRTPKDYTTVMEEAVQAGVAVKADTIEELAKLLNAPKLVEEVNNYNKMAVNGEDTQFHKDPKFMYAVDEGPYYGVIVDLRALGTLGGVAINENIQAIDDEGQPIDNLWVAGADAGGMYGNNYVKFEGGTLGFAYNSGRIAGENASVNAKK